MDQSNFYTIENVRKAGSHLKSVQVAPAISPRYKDIEKRGIYKCVDTQIISTMVNI